MYIRIIFNNALIINNTLIMCKNKNNVYRNFIQCTNEIFSLIVLIERIL